MRDKLQNIIGITILRQVLLRFEYNLVMVMTLIQTGLLGVPLLLTNRISPDTAPFALFGIFFAILFVKGMAYPFLLGHQVANEDTYRGPYAGVTIMIIELTGAMLAGGFYDYLMRK